MDLNEKVDILSRAGFRITRREDNVVVSFSSERTTHVYSGYTVEEFKDRSVSDITADLFLNYNKQGI